MEQRSRKKKQAAVDQTLCVACGCCVKVCPVSAIDIWRGLYAQVDVSRCISCGKCAKECPASVILLREVVA